MPLTRFFTSQARPQKSHDSEDAFSMPSSEVEEPAVAVAADASPENAWRAAQLEPLSGKTRTARAKVTFSPHFRHHPYNPELRVSTSLKPLLYQQLRLQSPASPLLARQQGDSTVLQPNHSAPQGASGPASSSPMGERLPGGPRSILRKKADVLIRVAPNVESGTQRNRQEGRTGHTRRRSLVRLDTFQLAKRAAGQEQDAHLPSRPLRAEPAGKAGAVSRHSSVSVADGAHVLSTSGREDDQDGNAEAGPSTPRVGVSAETSPIDSLLDVVVASHCTHADDFDLFAIEDAYGMLMTRFRSMLSTKAIAAAKAGAQTSSDDLSMAIEAFRARVPGLFSALKRDVGNLVGSKPSDIACPVNEDSSSPMVSPVAFPHGVTAARPLSPPRSSASPQSDPEQPRKRGYTAAEVRHRRAMAAVGQEALKFLALVFYRPELHSCFTDADLNALLAAVLVIPNTLKLYTPNPKKSYAFAIYALANMRIPADCVQPLKRELQRALSNAVGEVALQHWGGGPGKVEGGGGGNVKARTEGFTAIRQVMTVYPEDFSLDLNPFLEATLKGICDPAQGTPQTMRVLATRALLSCLQARMDWQDRVVADLQALEERRVQAALDGEGDEDFEQAQQALLQQFQDIQTAVRNSSIKVTQLLKAKPPRHSGSPTPPSARSLWAKLIRVLHNAMEPSPEWACATWAALVTLLGDAYMLPEFWREMNEVVLRPVQDFEQDVPERRIELCSYAWRHALHAGLLGDSTYDITTGIPILQTSAKALTRTRLLEMAAALPRAALAAASLQDLALEANAPGNKSAAQESKENTLWIAECFSMLAVAMESYSGALSQSDWAQNAADRHTAYNTVFDKVFLPSLREGLASTSSGVQQSIAWSVLAAATATSSASHWRPNDTLSKELLQYAGFKASARVSETDFSLSCGWIGAAWVMERFGTILDLLQIALNALDHVTARNGWVESSTQVAVIPMTLMTVWNNILAAVGAADKSSQACAQAFQCITRFLSDFMAIASTRVDISSPQKSADDRTYRKLAIAEVLLRALKDSLIAPVVGTMEFNLTPQQNQNRRDARSPSAEHAPTISAGIYTLPGYLLERHQAALLTCDDTGLASNTFNLLLSLGSDSERTYAQVVRDAERKLQNEGPSAVWTTLWRLIAGCWCKAPAIIGEKGTCSIASNLLAMSFRAMIEDRQTITSWPQLLVKITTLLDPQAASDFLAGFAAAICGEDMTPTSAHLEAIAMVNAAFDFALPPSVTYLSWLSSFLQPICGFESDATSCDQAVEILLSVLAQAATAGGAVAIVVFHALRPIVNAFLTPCASAGDPLIVDKMYIQVLDLLASAMAHGAIEINSVSLALYSDTFAFRVASTTEEQVVDAFQAFWNETFGTVKDLEYDDDLKHLLRSFLRTDSQFLVVPGLQMESLTEEVTPSGYDADISRTGGMGTMDVNMTVEPVEDNGRIKEPAEVEAALRATMPSDKEEEAASAMPTGQAQGEAQAADEALKQAYSDRSKKPGIEVIPDSQTQEIRPTPTRSLRKAASGTLAVVNDLGKAVGRMLGSWSSPTAAVFPLGEIEPVVAGPLEVSAESPAAHASPARIEVDETPLEEHSSAGRKRRQDVAVEIAVPSKRRRSSRQKDVSEIVAENLPAAPFSPPHTRRRTMAKKAMSRLGKSKTANAASGPSLSQKSHDSQADMLPARTAEQQRLSDLVAEAAALAEHGRDLDMVAISDILEGMERIRASVMQALRVHVKADAPRRGSSMSD